MAACAPGGRGGRGAGAGGQGGGDGGQSDGSGGGGAGGGEGGAGGGGGSGPGVEKCSPGDRACDGSSVRTCDGAGGPSGPVIEMCTDACSNGRCTSSACADAERLRNFVGCLFYAVDVDNTSRDDPKLLDIIVGNPSALDSAAVEIQSRMPGGGDVWMADKKVSLAPGGVEVITMADRHHEGSGRGAALAWRVASDAPIVAYQVQSNDSDYSESSGGTMLVPAHVFGRAYMPITYTQKVSAPVLRFEASSAASQVVIVGTRDGTTVKFKVSPVGSTRGEAEVPATGPGETFERVIDDGDVFQIYSDEEGDDLTGSEITADRPIAVFSGNIATAYGLPYVTVNSADMTHEQMIPLSTWGRSYVASRLVAQDVQKSAVTGCPDPDPGTLWRILASEDDTTVSVEGAPGVTGLPSSSISLARGRFRELTVSGPKDSPGDFFIKANKPILVAQFQACEPGMALSVSAEQLLQDFLFVTPPIFEHQLAIVRKAGSPVTLDGKTLPDANFAPAGGGFEVARVEFPRCMGALATCAHRLKGTEIGVALRGQDTICGYSFAGGMGLRCVNKTAGCF